MTAPTKTAPKPAPPKAKASTKPGGKPTGRPTNPAPTEVKPAETKSAAVPTPRTGNSAYAPEPVLEQMAVRQAQLRADGWTRPMISALTGFSDSQVWRAQNRKVHTVELEAWMDFIAKVDAGEYKPTGKGRKLRVEDLQARVTEALEVLANEAKTAAQYRKVVEAAQEILRDVVPQAAQDEDDASTEPEAKTDGDADDE